MRTHTHTHSASACVVKTVRKTLTLLFVCTLDNWRDLMKFVCFLKKKTKKNTAAAADAIQQKLVAVFFC